MSKIFYVSYDLKDADSGDYSKLEDILVNDYNGIRVQKSLWCLKLGNDYECSDIRDELLESLDKEDKIIVTQINSFAYNKCIEKPHFFDKK